MLIALFFVASGFMGCVIPPTGVLALEQHGAIAGTASALMGTLQMLTGALMMGAIASFTNGSPIAMVAGMTAGVALALMLTWLTLGGQRATAQAVAGR